MEEVKVLEAIRASLFPVPNMSMIDQRLQIDGRPIQLRLRYAHECPPEERSPDCIVLKIPGKGRMPHLLDETLPCGVGRGARQRITHDPTSGSCDPLCHCRVESKRGRIRPREILGDHR